MGSTLNEVGSSTNSMVMKDSNCCISISKNLEKAEQRLNKIDSTISNLSQEISDEIFTNNLLNSEIICDLGVKIVVNENSIELSFD
jgi:hypothetical protein